MPRFLPDGMSGFRARRDKFLAELATLSRKHGIAISGCGCCGSPRLDQLDESEENGIYVVDEGDGNLDWKKF